MEVTPQLVKEGLAAYKLAIKADKDRINEKINGLTKNALKELLKSYMGVQLACNLLEEPFETRHSDETVNLVQQSFKLQEDCMGYMTLNKEMEENNV